MHVLCIVRIVTFGWKAALELKKAKQMYTELTFMVNHLEIYEYILDLIS